MYKVVKDHPLYQPGVKMICLMSMPDTPEGFSYLNVIPKQKMIFTIKSVVTVGGRLFIQFDEIVNSEDEISSLSTRPRGAMYFPVEYFVRYEAFIEKLSEDEKRIYDLFYFNVN